MHSAVANYQYMEWYLDSFKFTVKAATMVNVVKDKPKKMIEGVRSVLIYGSPCARLVQ